MKNVAVVGEFASGKTTLADKLISEYGYRRISFAGNLKKAAAAVYDPTKPGVAGYVEKTAMYRIWPLDEPEPIEVSGREILQRLGQSVKQLDRLFWIRWLMNEVDCGIHGPGPFVIDDCRFPYEADALRNRGFVIARIVTPADTRMERYELTYGRRPTEAELSHPSEVEVQSIRWDTLVDGTLAPDDSARLLVARMVEAEAAA